jgi:hypothetical protein
LCLNVGKLLAVLKVKMFIYKTENSDYEKASNSI